MRVQNDGKSTWNSLRKQGACSNGGSRYIAGGKQNLCTALSTGVRRFAQVELKKSIMEFCICKLLKESNHVHEVQIIYS